MNPISQLIQLSQARKEREPEYTLIEEKGAPERRESSIEIEFDWMKAQGTGSNKKIAAIRNAAIGKATHFKINFYNCYDFSDD